VEPWVILASFNHFGRDLGKLGRKSPALRDGLGVIVKTGQGYRSVYGNGPKIADSPVEEVDIQGITVGRAAVDNGVFDGRVVLVRGPIESFPPGTWLGCKKG
jgi:hypothetical protein